MNDARLVEEFQRTGDEAAFESIVARHRGPTFRLVLSILGPGHDGEAEELTQDVFVRVYQKLGAFRGEAQLSTWVYRIAYNVALDYRARAAFRLPHHGEEALEMRPSKRPQDDPFAAVSSERTAATVDQCLAELPDLYRSVLHQHYWLGMTVSEISDLLGAPQGTVKSYMHRARRALHALLTKKGMADV